MKKFKYMFYLIAILLSAIDLHAQQNPFLGTWHSQSGNNVFVVSLWKDTENNILGHFKMITVNSSGQQTNIIYNSKKSLRGSSSQQWPYTIFAGPYDGGSIESGVITDNTVSSQRGFIGGQFKMTLAGSFPETAHWEVTKPQGLQEPGEPNFNIPTNVVLTKVSSTVNLD